MGKWLTIIVYSNVLRLNTTLASGLYICGLITPNSELSLMVFIIYGMIRVALHMT